MNRFIQFFKDGGLYLVIFFILAGSVAFLDWITWPMQKLWNLSQTLL